MRYVSGVGLGSPIVAVPAAGAAIGALIALVQNALDDDWSEGTVFRSHAQEIHSAMLAMQCLLGGSTTAIVDTYGNTICPGRTEPACKLSSGLLVEWRSLRDGFSSFWADTTSTWSFGATNAEALRLKDYARKFYAFYLKISKVCKAQGALLPSAPGLPETQIEKPAPAWLKWTVAGIIAVSVAFTIRSLARS